MGDDVVELPDVVGECGEVGCDQGDVGQPEGVDPALASGPLLTTINDSLGLAIYLGLATLLLVGGA